MEKWHRAWNELTGSHSLPRTWRGREVIYRVVRDGGATAIIEVPAQSGQGTYVVGIASGLTPEAACHRALMDARWQGLGAD